MGGTRFRPIWSCCTRAFIPPLTLLAFAAGSDLFICPLTPTIDSLVRVSRRVRDGRAALRPHPAAACCVSKAGDYSPATFRSASAAQSGRARRELRLSAADHRRSTVPATAASASPSTISHPFHPLSKVLFIFPSRYLFAIGLLPIFSLWCDLPPALGCIPKQPDSSAGRIDCSRCVTGLSPSPALPSSRLTQPNSSAPPVSTLQHPDIHTSGFPKLSSSRFTRRYWGNHCYFLLLRLLICLSSAGRLACLRPRVCHREFYRTTTVIIPPGCTPSNQVSHYCFGPQPHTPYGTCCVQIPNVSHMQVTLLFAPCCVLHRCKSPEIHC